ncbi:MAG: matrixin family metalloprotease, partial [Bacilli bacterium]
MKISLKLCSLSILSAATIIINAQVAQAGDLVGDSAFFGKNNYAISGKYIINSTYSTHSTAFTNAISKINNVSNANINLTPTYQYENLRMVSINSSSLDYYGLTNFSTSFASINMNEYSTSRDFFTQANYNKVALHEVGHAFGLEHQETGTNSVMKQGQYSYTDYTSLDKSNIAYK